MLTGCDKKDVVHGILHAVIKAVHHFSISGSVNLTWYVLSLF